jgi:hypothetical protein
VKQSPEEIRRVLNIHFCPTCAVDTMPSDKDGQCFFCGTLLIEEKRQPEPEPEPPKVGPNGLRLCRNLLHEMTEENTSSPGRGGKRCRACMRISWRRSNARRKGLAA